MPELTPPAAQKILVIEVAGLGDNVHLLPALWLVRRSYPGAALHVAAARGTADLFRLTPWVDRVWAYPWNPRPGLREHLAFGMALRRERFDLAINFSGSDRTTVMTRLTGARERWGRRPHDGGMRGFDWFYTRVLEQPFYTEPMYWQKWRCLAAQGFTGSDAPEFHVDIRPELQRRAGIEPGDEGRYLHVSPFTTAQRRELAPAQMAELLAGLRRAFPDYRLVLSCAPGERETRKLAALLERLDAPPWKVFAGTLDIPALAAVVQRAALNLCGDTGSLHLALMTGAPAVAWFRKHAHDAEHEWLPPGPQYRVLVSDQGTDEALGGIANDALLGAARELLAAGVAG
jgi:ADP-heptose:LPS heptosyltransferase